MEVAGTQVCGHPREQPTILVLGKPSQESKCSTGDRG